MRAEFQKNRARVQILIVISLADINVLHQPRVLVVGHGLQLLGKGAVFGGVRVALANEQAHLADVVALYLGLILAGGHAVAVNVDQRVRVLLHQLRGHGARAPVGSRVVRKEGFARIGHVDALFLQILLQRLAHVVDARALEQRAFPVAGNIGLVAVRRVHADQLFRVRLIRERGKRRHRVAGLVAQTLRHGAAIFVVDGNHAVQTVVAGDVLVSLIHAAHALRDFRARFVHHRVNSVVLALKSFAEARAAEEQRQKKRQRQRPFHPRAPSFRFAPRTQRSINSPRSSANSTAETPEITIVSSMPAPPRRSV